MPVLGCLSMCSLFAPWIFEPGQPSHQRLPCSRRRSAVCCRYIGSRRFKQARFRSAPRTVLALHLPSRVQCRCSDTEGICRCFIAHTLASPIRAIAHCSGSPQLVWARLAILALTPGHSTWLARSRSLPNQFLPRRNHRSKPVRRGLNALLIARSWKAQTILHTYPSTPLLRTLKVFVSSRAVCSRRLPRFAAEAGSSLSFLVPTTGISQNLVSAMPRIKPRTCLLQILFPTSPSASLLPWYSWVPRQFFLAPWSSVRNGIFLPLLSLLSSYPKASSPASRIGPISWQTHAELS